MLRKLYDWTLRLAKCRYASWVLAAVSFAESSVFPIAPDVLLIPMTLANRRKWAIYASICLVTSILGAFLGYYIGAVLYDSIGKSVLAFYGKQDIFQKIADWNNQWGGWGILLAAVTPFPYKAITIFSGFTHISLIKFTIMSLIGRGIRFYLVAGLVFLVGPPAMDFIEKHPGLVFSIAMILIIGGIALTRLVL